jgi:hypothetical protein
MSTTEKPPGVATPLVSNTGGARATPTDYIVLTSQNKGDGWIAEQTISATSSAAALREFLKGVEKNMPDALVAVPARSWQPVKPKTTTKTITTLEAL